MTDSIQVWDNYHGTNQHGTCPEPSVARWAMRRWGGREKDAKGLIRLLEVGCGTGAQAKWLGEHGFMVDAVDSSANTLRRANVGNPLPHAVRFYHISVLNLTFKDDWYDGVVDVCCLQHVDDLAAALKQIWRVLKPGGALFSIFASADHTDVMDGDFVGAAFHRLTLPQVHDVFGGVFAGGLKIETAIVTDGDRHLSHWLIEATK